MVERRPWSDAVKEGLWHFDPSRTGVQDIISIGRFVGDWESVLASLDIENSTAYIFSDAYLKDMRFPERLSSFNIIDTIPEIFQKMADYLKLSFPIVRIQPLLPGKVTPLHIDQYTEYKNRLKKQGFATENLGSISRFVVALEDWDWGHFFLIGNSVWHQWKKGDIVTWKYGTPHATANAGKKPRFILTITGVPDKKHAHRCILGQGDIIL